jgi:zinc/manganese transport system permease protein
MTSMLVISMAMTTLIIPIRSCPMLDVLVAPFTDYAFMRRALAACIIMAFGGAPLGVFLTLRRMTLVGDAMSHAILPGVGLAFAVFGLSLIPLTIGGLLTGAAIALLAVLLTRYTSLKEDASFTLLYLISIAGGVTLISMNGSNVDLMHLLFGDILALDNPALLLIAGTACLTLFVLAWCYRGLIIDCFDPDYARATQRRGNQAGLIFFILLVINLVAAFQALGTLMALGLMILPALVARFWARTLDGIMALSILLALVAAPTGLLVSYYADLPAGPALVLTLGLAGLVSAITGRYGSVRAQFVA